MAVHAGRVTALALIGVGAAFDFHTGRKRQSPAECSVTAWSGSFGY